MVQRRYFPSLKAYLLKWDTLSEMDVDDILQELMLVLQNKVHLYNKRYAFSTWLFRIARNQALNHLRRNDRHEVVNEDNPEHLSIEGNTPESDLLRAEEHRFIQKFLEDCTARQREAAFLFYFEEMKIKEIALVLDIAPGTVKALLHQLRGKLKEAWNEKMV